MHRSKWSPTPLIAVPPESWPSDCVTLTLCYPETMQRLRFQTNWFANWLLANMQTTSGENRSIQINATLYSAQRIEVHPCSYLTQFVLWKFVGLVDPTKMNSFYFAILSNQIAFNFDTFLGMCCLLIVSKHWQSIVLRVFLTFLERDFFWCHHSPKYWTQKQHSSTKNR